MDLQLLRYYLKTGDTDVCNNESDNRVVIFRLHDTWQNEGRYHLFNKLKTEPTDQCLSRANEMAAKHLFLEDRSF